MRDRAWAFQEWLLSSRIAHFSRGELLWECKTHQRCECQTICFMHWKYDHHQEIKLVSSDNYGTIEGQQKPFNWNRVVEEFTRRRLTYPEDALPALSGLAEILRIRTGQDYIGGLWKESLPDALLWIPERTFPGRMVGTKRRDSYYSPCWSWASVVGDHSIHFEVIHPQVQYVAEIIRVSWEPVNASNPFGPLLSGHVKLKGLLATLPKKLLNCKLKAEVSAFIAIGRYPLRYNLSLDITAPAFEITSMNGVVVFIINITGSMGHGALKGLCLKRAKNACCFERIGIMSLLCDRHYNKDNDKTGCPDLEKWTSMLKLKEGIVTII